MKISLLVVVFYWRFGDHLPLPSWNPACLWHFVQGMASYAITVNAAENLPQRGGLFLWLFLFKIRGIWGISRYWNSSSRVSWAVTRREASAPSLSAKYCWQCLWLVYIVLPCLREFIFQLYCKTCKIMCIDWNSKASMAKWNAFLQCCNLFLLLPSNSMAFLKKGTAHFQLFLKVLKLFVHMQTV